jgi:hypothetical protein
MCVVYISEFSSSKAFLKIKKTKTPQAKPAALVCHLGLKISLNSSIGIPKGFFEYGRGGVGIVTRD